MSSHFISFAASLNPSSSIYASLNRIERQVKDLDIFDNFYGFTDKDLKEDLKFWEKHHEFIKCNTRGYGWWFWKPYIIKKYLENINEGDTLVYCDSGCEILNDEAHDTVNAIFSNLKTNNVLMFPHSLKQHIDCYNKQVCYNFFNVTEKDFLKHGLYFEANRIFLTKNKACIALVDEWWSVMTDNYFTFDSSTIQEFPEKPTFKETRGDQTILNFVLLKHNMLHAASIVSSASKTAGKVFIAARNKSGVSKYK